MTLPPSTDVVVLGAGVAGLSAAVRLAAAGRRVVVLDAAPRLGGRATAFADRETGERVDNGQHVLFGCYRETYRFLDAIGSAHLAPLQPRLSLQMAGPDGRLSRLSCPPLPPPWHLMAGVLAWRAIPLGDRLSARGMLPLVRQSRREGPEAAAARVADDLTVDRWLAACGQSPRLREWLWHPLAIAALNQSPAIAAARPFARVVDELFAEPARRFVESRGGVVATQAPGVVQLAAGGAVAGVRTNDATIAAPVVVSSVPWHAFGRIWDGGPPDEIEDVASNAAAMGSSPIVTVNLWLDREVVPAPYVGLVDGPMHWVFDKAAIFGEHAAHLSIVASGAVELEGRDNAAITAIAVEQLQRALPRMRGATVRRSVVVRERRATFSLAPGSPPRPSTRTRVAGFYLAGDWTDTGLPATIEGAVVSGHRAADAVLTDTR